MDVTLRDGTMIWLDKIMADLIVFGVVAGVVVVAIISLSLMDWWNRRKRRKNTKIFRADTMNLSRKEFVRLLLVVMGVSSVVVKKQEPFSPKFLPHHKKLRVKWSPTPSRAEVKALQQIFVLPDEYVTQLMSNAKH